MFYTEYGEVYATIYSIICECNGNRAFCDLCDWDTRIYIAASSMLFNQIMIINSDLCILDLKIRRLY